MVTKKSTKKPTAKKTVTPKKVEVAKPVVEAKVETKTEKCTCGCCDPRKKIIAVGIVVVLLGLIAAVACPCKKDCAKKFDEKVDQKIAAWIEKNPLAVIESVNKYFEAQQAKARQDGADEGCGAAPAKERQARPAPKKADKALLNEILGRKDLNVLGNPNGKFVMIEFFDYQCGYCKKANKAMAEAIKKSNNIRWVVVDTPIFGESSELIARYANAAAKQGKFAQFHHEIGEAKGRLDEVALKEIGKKLKMDVEKLAKDADSQEMKDRITKNKQYTRQLGMGGVPGFIIDGDIQSGFFPQEQMDRYIEKANSMK